MIEFNQTFSPKTFFSATNSFFCNFSHLTGPSGLRMHRQKCLDSDYVGEGDWGWTSERTSSANYLLKAAPGTPHPRPKSSYMDAYGWGAWGALADLSTWRHSGHHIKVI